METTIRRTRSRRVKAAAAALTASLVSVGAAGLVAAGENSTALPNGATLSAEVTSPQSGDVILAPSGQSSVDVPLTGTASVGLGEPDVAWIYVFDVSGSAALDCDGSSTIITCEKNAIGALNDLVVDSESAIEVGIAAFGENAATADISSAAGSQLLTAPEDPDVDTVISSVNIGTIGQFTNRSIGSDGTDFAAGLGAANTLVNAATAGTVNVVFLSDGLSNEGSGFNTILSDVADDATIYPFAIGEDSNCAGGSNGTLAAMAAASGTPCVEVPDPSDLESVVTNVIATSLLTVDVELDGSPIAASVSPAPPQPGPVSVDWSAMGFGLAPGHHEVCVTATGRGPDSDPSAVGSVTRCETFAVVAFELSPPHAINELGSDDTHSVTATVVGPAGEVDGWPVNFTVSGANAGEAGTCDPLDCTTDVNGEVTFTYSVPVEPESLGLDTITGAVNVDGVSASLDVTKLWQDTTPPTADCVAGVNPEGDVPSAPGNGGQGMNQDGFYELVASDDVWPADAIEVFVQDSGTGHVFGPFDVGTVIKWVESNGAQPSQKPGDGEVDYKLKGQGDAIVYAVDGSGNVSDTVDCLVPNAPQ